MLETSLTMDCCKCSGMRNMHRCLTTIISVVDRPSPYFVWLNSGFTVVPTWYQILSLRSKADDTSLKTTPRASMLKSLIHCTSLPTACVSLCYFYQVYVRDRTNNISAKAVWHSFETMLITCWWTFWVFLQSSLSRRDWRFLVRHFGSICRINEEGMVCLHRKLQSATSMKPLRRLMSWVAV